VGRDQPLEDGGGIGSAAIGFLVWGGLIVWFYMERRADRPPARLSG
jgi:hypothetical protein